MLVTVAEVAVAKVAVADAHSHHLFTHIAFMACLGMDHTG